MLHTPPKQNVVNVLSEQTQKVSGRLEIEEIRFPRPVCDWNFNRDNTPFPGHPRKFLHNPLRT